MPIPQCLIPLAEKGELYGAIDLFVHHSGKNVGIGLIGCKSNVDQFVLDQKDPSLQAMKLDKEGNCQGCFFCSKVKG
jgi:hypothetical protein